MIGNAESGVPKGGPALLELSGVSKRFVKPLDLPSRMANLLGARLRAEVVHAVDHVDLAIAEREVVGLVGESGCGKSTLGRIAVGMLPPTEGERRWRGAVLPQRPPAAARQQQLRMQMIFQDPYASLNPRMRVLDIVGEAPVAHGLIAAQQQVEYVGLQLNRVGLDPTLMRRFPHQFSGGQRARIGIARALAVKPEFLVCDESVAALDVSIQAQVLNLFMDLRAALNLTYLFISHDLGVVRHVSDRVVDHVSRTHRRIGPDRASCSRRPTIRIRRRCCRRSARSSRRSGASSLSAARSRRRSSRRRAAISIRAARTRCRNAARSRHRSRKSRRGAGRHAISTT